jgi:hypothetical protein
MFDVAVYAERNMIKKEAEILKYKYLNSRNSVYAECKNKSDTNNKKGNWDHFRIIQKGPEQQMPYLPGKQEIKELQKTAILGTAHIPRKVMM